jgi:hypothetical protein
MPVARNAAEKKALMDAHRSQLRLTAEQQHLLAADVVERNLKELAAWDSFYSLPPQEQALRHQLAIRDKFLGKRGTAYTPAPTHGGFSIGTNQTFLFELPAGQTLADAVVHSAPLNVQREVAQGTASKAQKRMVAHIPPQYIKALIDNSGAEPVLHILK